MVGLAATLAPQLMTRPKRVAVASGGYRASLTVCVIAYNGGSGTLNQSKALTPGPAALNPRDAGICQQSVVIGCHNEV